MVKSKNQKPKTEQTETAQQNVRQEKFRLDFDDDASRISVFNVVIGSFSNRQNAINLKNAQMPDYNPIIVVNEKGMFRVILISYKTYEQAKEKISKIVDRFPDAWVLIQEK
ncbi:MAG: SPOR domain-containing protein [Bacteroidota bacterium]